MTPETSGASIAAAAALPAPVLELRNVAGESRLGPLSKDIAGEGVTFTLRAGEVGVLIGGKETSSLLRLIMGLGTLGSGEVRLLDKVVLNPRTHEIDSRAIRQKIGYGFRDKGLLSNLSLLANVDLPAKYHGFYRADTAPGTFAEAALDELGVGREFWQLRPNRISWDIRKKVLFARSVVLNPPVLILDDPSAMLASPMLPEILAWIKRRQAKGTGILLGTNDYTFGIAAASWILHPKDHVATTHYADFIDTTWIRSAALLAERLASL